MATARWMLLLGCWLAASAAGCPPRPAAVASGVLGDANAELPGMDSSSLTARERQVWRGYLSELLAPCADVAVPIDQCITEKRPCAACAPAARYVMQQVRAGHPEGQVLELFEARFDSERVRTIVVGDSASSGPADAPVTVVEFADFQCPFCSLMSDVLRQLREQFPNRLRVVFKHYPISYHANAHVAARAAAAAQQQGQFWPMLHTFFANQDRLSESELRRYASEAGLDMERFERDLSSPRVHRQVDREHQQGKGLGIRGTPTLFINGREVPLKSLDDPLRDMREWIELELELVGSRPSAPAVTAKPRGAK